MTAIDLVMVARSYGLDEAVAWLGEQLGWTDGYTFGPGFYETAAAKEPKGQAEARDTGELPGVIVRCANTITPEAIRWLWPGWLARGKLELIAGAPEAGKTTIALSYAAILSSGGLWPDGTQTTIGNVLIWTSEDDVADTIIPRLIRMGADLSRIFFIEQMRPAKGVPRPFNPATDMTALNTKARSIGDIAMLVLDPVVAAIPMTRNSHNNTETRNGLQPVVDFGRAIDAVVLGITHLSKGTAGKDPVERIIGSSAFGALPRLVMLAAKSKDEDGPPRIMVRGKTNITKSGGGFGYDIEAAPLDGNPAIEATCIVWGEALQGMAQELLNAAEAADDQDTESKLAEAEKFLRTVLANEEQPAESVKAGAAMNGISERTLRRAAKKICKKRKDGRGGWFWWLS